ncbi:MAG: RNase adapter RapZ [Gammaproteobacteria bacterium]|jgi:RNase adapter protein RapZ|nr:RNase adapter RapZ [Gammaproteobacteria bacterium]
MKIIVLSGRSGSGKSTALTALEDAGFNCIDNFPVMLLQSLVHNTLRDSAQQNSHMAVCIDARSHDLEKFPELLLSIDRMDVDCEVIYLDAVSTTLVKRFSETRRRHPLTNARTDLSQAIDAEGEVLESIADLADLVIDSTNLSAQELRQLISTRVAKRRNKSISLLFRSFGFKYGVPLDANIVFDLRCLPNPYWEKSLRSFTGQDRAVEDFLSSQPAVTEMFNDISQYLDTWIPRFEAGARAYMTVALGCTGGQHRSVYLAERLAQHFSHQFDNVLLRHRELAEKDH